MVTDNISYIPRWPLTPFPGVSVCELSVQFLLRSFSRIFRTCEVSHLCGSWHDLSHNSSVRSPFHRFHTGMASPLYVFSYDHLVDFFGWKLFHNIHTCMVLILCDTFCHGKLGLILNWTAVHICCIQASICLKNDKWICISICDNILYQNTSDLVHGLSQLQFTEKEGNQVKQARQ